MPILPVKLGKIAVNQLSPSLPLGKKPISPSQSYRTVQKTKDGQHWFVPGKTGMGKTTFIKDGLIQRLTSLHHEINVYHLDTKKQGDFTARDGVIIVSEHAPDAFTTAGNRMVWQPIYDEKDEYNRFFKNILNAGKPAIVNIDECINMNFNGHVPRELGILLMQGRAFGIHVIGGTQRIAKSPPELQSQATYIACFNMTNTYDQRTAIELLDLPDSQKKLGLKRYELYFRDMDMDKPAIKYSSYQKVLPFIH